MKQPTRVPSAVVWPVVAIIAVGVASRLPENYFAHLNSRGEVYIATNPGEIVAPVSVTPYTTHVYIQRLRDDLRTVRMREPGSAMAACRYNDIAQQVDPSLLKLNNLPLQIVAHASPSRKP